MSTYNLRSRVAVRKPVSNGFIHWDDYLESTVTNDYTDPTYGSRTVFPDVEEPSSDVDDYDPLRCDEVLDNEEKYATVEPDRALFIDDDECMYELCECEARYLTADEGRIRNEELVRRMHAYEDLQAPM